MAELEGGAGQAAAPDSTGTTGAAPPATGEQSANVSQTTQAGPAQTDSDSFFDPKSIEHSPELKAAYKQMQAAYTKKSQSIKEARQKVEAYDNFVSNPMGTMQQLAQQYGYSLVQRDPQAKPDETGPKTWDDVYSRAKQEVLKELEPVIGEVQNMKRQNVEAYLDNSYPDWRTYEDEMVATLQEHPSLAKDPDKLYRLSLPPEVLEARAAKRAMERLKNGNDAGKISGTSTTGKTAPVEGPPKGGSFNDYVAYAKAKLASQGIGPG